MTNFDDGRPDEAGQNLKPCPFCGGKAVLKKRSGTHYGTIHRCRYYRAHVECKKCGARTDEQKAPGFAEKRWNTRAGEAT